MNSTLRLILTDPNSWHHLIAFTITNQQDEFLNFLPCSLENMGVRILVKNSKIGVFDNHLLTEY